MIRIAALAFLASLSFAAPTLAQYGPTWSRAESLQGVPVVLDYGAYPLDDGGVMTFAGEASPGGGGFPDELVVTRYGRDGALSWRTREPIAPFVPFPGFGPATPTIDVRGNGSAAFAVLSGEDLQVLAFDPDGSLRWRKTIQATRPFYWVSASRPFVDAADEIVLGTLESRAFFDWTVDEHLTAIERFDASGTSIFRTETTGRKLETCIGTPSGDVLVVTNDTLTPLAPPVRMIERIDRSGAQVAAANHSGNAQLWQAIYDPRTDGALFVSRLSTFGQTFPFQIEVYDATGVLLANGDFGTSGYAGLGSAVDPVSGIAYFGGYDGTIGEVVGYDLLATEVVSALMPGSIAAWVQGVRPGGGVVTLETRSSTINAAGVSASGTRLFSTAVAPRDGSFELTQNYATAQDGRLWITSARSRVMGSGVPSSRSIEQWVEGVPGMEYCSAVANSTGSPGHLVARGSQVASQNRITLAADSLPPSSFGFFVGGQNQGFTPAAGGSQGTLCLSSPIGRFSSANQIRQVTADGRTSLELDLTNIPTPGGFVAITGGQTWSFQLWHRDANPGPTSNFTNGVEITFQ